MRSTSKIAFLLSLATIVASTAAQIPTTLTAHPQETVQNGNGNLVPFGISSTGSFASGRTMILVPKDELPTVPCLLFGIQVECQQNVALTYNSLTINCAPTTASTLVNSFAANYTTAPTTVLSVTNFTVNWQNNVWVSIPFQTPYVHDGVSAMILEIQKELPGGSFATMSTSSSPQRTDRPNMIYAFGGVGANASQATNAQVNANALSFRAEWQGTPTVRNRSDVGPGSNQYGIGGSVTLTVAGTAGTLYALAAGNDFLPVQVPVPGFNGAVVIDNLFVFHGGVLGASGEDAFVFNIPANPAFVGLYLTYQGAVIDPSTGITLTNGTDHFVNS